MAITSLGSLGGTSAKSAGTTLSLSPSQSLSIGDWAVWWVAWESAYFFGPDERQNRRLKCTDDGGNYYSSLATWYPPGGASSLAAIFIARIRDTFTTSTTVTFTNAASLTPKAVSGWAFRGTDDATLRWAGLMDNTAGAGSIGVDPPAVTIGGLPSQEYLLLHVLAAEAPDTDAYTWDANYTQIDTHGTSGGAANTNVTCLGGWRIATLTTDTVDVTSDTADRNYDQALVAVCEVAYTPYLPSAPIIDTAVRADEEPLASPPWTTTGRPGFGNDYVRIASNHFARGVLAAGAGSQWWGSAFTSSDFEAYATMTTLGDGGVIYHGSGNGFDSTLDAYGFWYYHRAGDAGANVIFGSPGFNGDPASSNVIPVWRDVLTPLHLGNQYKNPVQHMWVGSASVYEWQAAYYRTAPFVKTGGTIGFNMENDTTVRFQDLGAGDAVVPTTRPTLPYLHVGP